MYFVYILKSLSKNFFYTGCTNDLKRRLNEHNNGEVVSTKPYFPFDLVYYEACINEKDAFRREKYLKSRLGKNYLRKRLENWLRLKS
ncbi:GIY-YIG nuclease family protein [Candidatus Microgenomates bacterium]|jgi:putative endonuclease|nr:MAG: GIY-YIG nuclease family protein [Candidatus Microgenomates bacterium]